MRPDGISDLQFILWGAQRYWWIILIVIALLAWVAFFGTDNYGRFNVIAALAPIWIIPGCIWWTVRKLICLPKTLARRKRVNLIKQQLAEQQTRHEAFYPKYREYDI